MYDIQRFEKFERRKPSKAKKILKFILFLSLVMFTLNVLTSSYIGKKSKQVGLFVSPLTTVKEVVKKTTSYFNSQENSKNLDKIVTNILGDEKSNYAVVIKNLDTGERYFFNQDKIYDTASLYKLWVMAVSYQMIENKTLDKQEVLSANVIDLNQKFNIASESAELTEGEVSWPVENALVNMITISDNYSALLLSTRVRLSNVSSFLKNNGLVNSKVGTLSDSPKTSASDIALFFEKLYNGDFANEEYTQEMLTLLKNQKINTKLSKNLPENVVIAHKTGELGEISHDSGIVYTNKGNYIIVTFSETKSPLNANEKIIQISRQVYDYFTK